MTALFEPVAWVGSVNIVVNLLLGLSWAVAGGCAFAGLPRGAAPVVFVCVVCGVYRATVAADYALYSESIRYGFQLTPAALIENLLLLAGLLWVARAALRGAG